MKCANSLCNRPAGTLQCPVCLNAGKTGSEAFFCGQECFKSSWPIHKLLHGNLFNNKSSYSSVIGSGLSYNPYPNYKYSGKLRPYPLSETRVVPSNINRPDYAETGIPKSEYDMRKSATVVKPLLSETIAKMRTVCKVLYY